MTFAASVYHFLGVDNKCDNCGKQLDVMKGYHKIAMWPQFAFFTWRWFRQTWFGDNRVLRFCFPGQGLPPALDCLAEFMTKGRLAEMQKK